MVSILVSLRADVTPVQEGQWMGQGQQKDGKRWILSTAGWVQFEGAF